jgi:hypothetical protein
MSGFHNSEYVSFVEAHKRVYAPEFSCNSVMQSEEKGLKYSYRFRLEAGSEGSGSEEQSKADIQGYINDILGAKKPKNPKDDLLTV